MPCTDGREREDNQRNFHASCILCAVVRKHGLGVLLDLDYKTMGLTPAQVLEWVTHHQAEDYARQKI